MKMELITTLIILAGYLSILIELTCFHVPSMASNRAIWRAEKQVTDFYSDKYQWIFNLTKLQKILVFNLPLVGVYMTFLFPLWLLLNRGNLLGPAIFSENVVAQILGILLVFVGRVITLASVVSIRKENSQQKECFKLHTGHVFNKSRNPGLLGMYIFMLGILLCLPSLMLLCGLIYYIVYMHFKVKMEEDFLMNKFGSHYQRYLHQTGRYIS